MFNKVAWPSEDASPIPYEMEQISEYMKRIEEATTQNSWESLARIAEKFATSPASLQEEKHFLVEVNLVKEYMTAYFRAGKFATLTLNDKKLRDFEINVRFD